MRIKQVFFISLVLLAVLGLCACAQNAPPEKPPGAATSETRPVTAAANVPESSPFILTASIQDLMLSIVDPSADYLWDSVSIISRLDGVVQNQPRTDMEWEEVRHKAIALLEATNLLAMKGRRVVEQGKKLQDEGVAGNLTSAQIQKLIDDDHATFEAFAHGLHEATMQALKAIDKRDVDAFFEAGGNIDSACEACHTKYWYPNQGIPYGP